MVMIGAANPIITLICVLADTLDMGDMEIGKEELEFIFIISPTSLSLLMSD